VGGGPRGERLGGHPSVNAREKSDRPVLPVKPPNKPGVPGAEVVEGRGLREGNAASKTRPGHRAGQGAPSALGRVRRIARQDKGARFTALLHHVDIDRLRAAYWALHPRAATGVDGVTWHDYGLDLEENLRGSARSGPQGWIPGEAVA
jgi:RNA-directed DNA polymerase